MANKGFNGSAVTFPSTAATVGQLRGISFDESAPEVNVTSSTASQGVVHAGVPMSTVSIDLVGGTTISSGDTGDLDVSWFDGTSAGSLPGVVVLDRSVSGSMDGEITSTVKFANSTT